MVAFYARWITFRDDNGLPFAARNVDATLLRKQFEPCPFTQRDLLAGFRHFSTDEEVQTGRPP